MVDLNESRYVTDLMHKTRMGLWTVEFDEGEKTRLYVNDVIKEIWFLDDSITPEALYEFFYDNIEPAYYEEVRATVENMKKGEHVDATFQWHYPGGRTWTIRCSGVRDFSYTKGVRMEGFQEICSEMVRIQKSSLADMLASLSDEFLDVYFLDPYTGSFEAYSNKSSYDGDDDRDFSTVNFYEDVAERSGGIVHPDDKPLIDEKYTKEHLISILETEQSEEFIVRWPIDAEGNCLYMMNKLACFKDYDGSKRVVIGVADVTKTKEAEKNLEEAMIAAESASKSKSTFLFNMSHDIRTPMNAIMGYTDRILKNIDNKELITDSVDKIKSSSEYLLQLINDVLDMARIESNRFELEDGLFDIYERANQICDIFSADFKRKNITLIRNFDDIQNRIALYDGLRVRQIVTNILSNAVKYTLDGGIVKYSIKQVPCDKAGFNRYVSIIEDNGIGMSGEYLDHIYEQFSRGTSATISKIQGTGLGMSIVKRMVDAMKGSIDIKSEPDKGTTVSITLDFRIPLEEDVKAFNSLRREEVDLKKLKGMKVLLVEDNAMNREIGEEMLTEIGCIVDTAQDGVEAVSKVSNSKPGDIDVILMDIQMPVMNGYEATKSIRALKNRELANVKIIALTANAYEEDRKDALEAGMNDHLAKPINIEKIVKKLAGIFNCEYK